jgi:hypothetical protein
MDHLPGEDHTIERRERSCASAETAADHGDIGA